MKHLLHFLVGLPGWTAAVLLALFPMAESSLLLGILVPGETALLLGGVLVYRGKIDFIAMAVIGAAAAVIGDTIGYFVGRKWGDRLLRTRLARRIGERRWERARRHLRGKGFWTVLVGRFGAGVRTLIPLLAGNARMPYRRFFLANFCGGVPWAISAVLLGWVAGAAWESAHWIALGAGIVVVGVIALVMWRRHASSSSDNRRPSGSPSSR